MAMHCNIVHNNNNKHTCITEITITEIIMYTTILLYTFMYY